MASLVCKNLRRAAAAPAAAPKPRRGALIVRRFKENGNGAAPATAKVQFTLPRHVPFGQEIAIVGEAETLGERQIEREIHRGVGWGIWLSFCALVRSLHTQRSPPFPPPPTHPPL